MNFLALCKRTRQECGIAGSGPSSVLNQTGELQRIVSWVAQSWIELQTARQDWDWMRKEWSFETVIGQSVYAPSAFAPTPVTDMNFILEDTARIYRQSIGIADEQYIDFWDYDSFRDTFMYGPHQNNRPSVLTVRPQDRAVLVGDPPDDVYVIYGDYMARAWELVNNTDEPDIPENFHMAIVYRAMRKYAAFENAPEVEAVAKVEGARLMRELTLDQSGGLTFGAPLA
jgi:hypothetical protein